VIWLKCIIERTLPDVSPAAGLTPILYLPNVARQDLRAGGDFPREKRHLMPLVELQYRGTVWHQRNGRDWTVEAFLTSADGLGLDVARDQRTREAMLRALPLLGPEPVAALRGRRLEAEDFDRLAIGDSVRDVLTWMSDADAFERRCDAGRWATFRDVCKRELGFDPDKGGIQTAADLLRQGVGKWNEVWQRFCDAPTLYPGIASVLRRARPVDLLATIDDQERRPGFNEEQEDALRTALEAATNLPHAQACESVIALDEEHKERRGWVWAKLGDSPFALVLEPLGRLACAARRPIGGSTAEQLIADYTSEGWRCDRSAIEALSSLKPGRENDLVQSVVRSLYEPWLDASARRLQELLDDGRVDPSKLASGVTAGRETCVLFADGLRFDLGMMLLEKLEASGHKTRMTHRFAPIPTVTPTAKPLASPAHGSCIGGNDAEGFCPLLTEGNKPVNAQRLRDAMARQRIEVLEADEVRMGVGAEGGGWTEIGQIDSLGHARWDLLVRQIEPELEAVVDRVESLLSAGWSAVRIVTDHGWLLLPGGLPKVELPRHLVATRWARCAAVQGGSMPSVPTYAWYWNPLLRIASPPGVGAFLANTEYAHGGVSLQECVVPELIVERGQGVSTASIAELSWRGMRCRIKIETNASGLKADLRLNWKQANTSIAVTPKEITSTGETSLAVADDSHEGAAATVVILDETGRVLDHKPTTVGEQS
jgi:hypothetical protein